MTTSLILGVLTGLALGATLMLSGLSTPRWLIDMLRLKDLHLLKVLVAALGVGILGVTLLELVGAAHLGVKTVHVAALILGGGIFGVGFAVSAYCPGTALAAAAQGRRDALFAVVGGLLGVGVFAALYEPIRPWLIEPLTYGKITFPGWLGVSRWVLSVPLAAVIGLVSFWWLRSGKTSAESAKKSRRRGSRVEPSTLVGAPR